MSEVFMMCAVGGVYHEQIKRLFFLFEKNSRDRACGGIGVHKLLPEGFRFVSGNGDPDALAVLKI
jgi:hypothetical protein